MEKEEEEEEEENVERPMHGSGGAGYGLESGPEKVWILKV